MSGRELLYTIFDQHKEAGRRHGHMRVTVPRINCSNSTGAYQPLVNATNNVEAGPSGKCASCLGIVLEGSVLDVAHVPTWHHACETAVGRRSSLISIDACTSPTIRLHKCETANRKDSYILSNDVRHRDTLQLLRFSTSSNRSVEECRPLLTGFFSSCVTQNGSPTPSISEPIQMAHLCQRAWWQCRARSRAVNCKSFIGSST